MQYSGREVFKEGLTASKGILINVRVPFEEYVLHMEWSKDNEAALEPLVGILGETPAAKDEHDREQVEEKHQEVASISNPGRNHHVFWKARPEINVFVKEEPHDDQIFDDKYCFQRVVSDEVVKYVLKSIFAREIVRFEVIFEFDVKFLTGS